VKKIFTYLLALSFLAVAPVAFAASMRQDAPKKEEAAKKPKKEKKAKEKKEKKAKKEEAKPPR
jgi:ribosomal protein L12E/L44/L45/RPP1/RPP2